MNSLSPKKELFLCFLLAAYSVYHLIISLVASWGFTTDDTFITWFYARQLAHGNGLNWHQFLPRVEGYSNFLWVLLGSLFIKLQWPLEQTIKWFSVLSLGASLIFLYRLGRLFFSPLLAILPIFLFSHYIGVAWWTISGMESTFFFTLSIFLMWQCAVAFGYSPVSDKGNAGSYSISSWIITNFVLLLLALTRFEGLIWVIPIILYICCFSKKNDLLGGENKYKFFYLWIFISVCCFVLPYVLYFLWRIYYFGHLIPNSFACKAIAPGEIGKIDLEYVQVIFPFMIASIPYFLESKDCRHILLWLPSLLYGVMLWDASPIITYFLRLFLAPFALFSLLPVLGVFQFFHYFRLREVYLKLMTCMLIILLTVLFIPGNDPKALSLLATNYQEKNNNRVYLANLLNKNAKYGATVLLGDCGIIPFNARPDIRFIDTLCLNNAKLTQAPFYNNLERYAEYLKNTVKPDWVIVDKLYFKSNADLLTNSLQRKHLFENYQLINPSLFGFNAIDDFYLIYQRV